MSCCRRIAALAFCAAVLTQTPVVRGDEVRPDRLYRLELCVQLPTEKEAPEFRPTATVPVTVFLDRQARQLLYLGEEGKSLAVVAAGKNLNEWGDRKPIWSHHLTMPVRTFDEKEFTARTRKIGVEVYRDENSGHLIYVSHTGSVAVTPAARTPPPDRLAPRWLDHLSLKVRRASDGFTDANSLPRCGVEVYQDENTGCLLYVADTGALAVLPQERTGADRKSRPPVWSHAQGVKARNFDEERFTGGTTSLSMEIYHDENRDVLLYLTETFRLAATPAAGKTIEFRRYREPEWRSRLRPKEGAGKWSVEVYRNVNVDHTLLVTPHGALAVLAAEVEPKK
jgi:hypothetical protein